MIQIMYKVGFFIFCIYWIVTIFFLLPDNPLSLKTATARSIFNTDFFQRWAFFAPPPNSNDRIYIIFQNKNTLAKDVFEVLSPLIEKRTRNPFNTHYATLDYVLSSTVIDIENDVRFLGNYFEYKNSVSKNKLTDSLIQTMIISEVEKSSDFKTLLNYAKTIATSKHINVKDVFCQLQISKIFIPQYIDRNNKTRKEQVSFRSNLLSLND